jgi:hypothetical protein
VSDLSRLAVLASTAQAMYEDVSGQRMVAVPIPVAEALAKEGFVRQDSYGRWVWVAAGDTGAAPEEER